MKASTKTEKLFTELNDIYGFWDDMPETVNRGVKILGLDKFMKEFIETEEEWARHPDATADYQDDIGKFQKSFSNDFKVKWPY